MSSSAYRSSSNVVYSAKYHLVWCPKYRRRVLAGAVETRLVRLMKGRSSRILRQEFPHLRRLPSLWTNSWFCSTVGGAPIDVVRRYVESQKLAA
ncbi:MAG: transposase [Actinomycetota bacterium]|jgi:putative transposase|nr:transposase [Actinomycetota bacterium]